MVILTVASTQKTRSLESTISSSSSSSVGDIEREYMLIANRTSVFFIRTCDFYHTVKPTKQKIPHLCELSALKTTYGSRPRYDQMNTIQHLINVPQNHLMIAADMNGTVTVTSGPPKMDIIRKHCIGSEITALEYICDKNFKAPLREQHDGSGVSLLVLAFRSISSAAGNSKSRIRLWNFRSNEIITDFDIADEITQFAYSQTLGSLFCSTWRGRIFQIVHDPSPESKTQGYKLSPTACDLGMEGRNLIREFQIGDTNGILSLSQSGYLKLWDLSSGSASAAEKYLECDALYHVGNCASTMILHYHRTRAVPVDQKKLEIDEGDMLIVTGNTKLCFLNPFDQNKPCLRRLEIPEYVSSIAQWRNLVMLGTKPGVIIGIDPFSGVQQIRVQLGIHAPVKQIVGGPDLLRAINDRGRLAIWALKGVEVVRVVELETEGCTVHNFASSKLPSVHVHMGSGDG